MPLRVAFVGTDTGVGKTAAAVAFRDHLLGRAYRIAALKPFVSGAIDGHWADCDVLDPQHAWPSPARFVLPLSPWGAVRRGETSPDPDAVRAYLVRAESECDAVIIEGIGGVMVPLNRDTSWIDLHAEFGWPTFVAGRGSLGTLNHMFLTIEALRARAIPVAGFALSAGGEGEGAYETARENAAMIEERTGVECLGVVAYDPVRPVAAWAAGVAWHRLEAGIA